MKLTRFTSLSIICASLLLINSSANAQISNSTSTNAKPTKPAPALFAGNGDYRTWSFGLYAGAMAPFAAAGGRNDFSKWQAALGYGIYIKKQISHVVGIQLTGMRGTLKANNDKLWAGAPPISPYKSFETKVNWAASLSAVITLGSINWSQLRTSIQPYVSVGGGAINFNPTLIDNAGASINFKPTGSLTEFYVPVGLGIKSNLSNSVNLNIGYTMGFVDADNLDGYFKAPYNSDRFSMAHIGLEFALGDSKKPQLAIHNAPAQLSSNMDRADDAMRASLAASEERYNQRLAEVADLKDQLNKMKMDSDGDGVSDYFDKCPNTPRSVKVDGAGCALPVPPPSRDTTIVRNNTYIITGEDRKIVDEAVRNLEFDFGKATIRERSFVYLNRVADLMNQKGIQLKLAGHTDNVGSDAANMTLSRNRADAVKNYMINKGVNSAKIESEGFGESKPIESNKTATGRQKNRRVEFTIY
jgi:OOP family OmpA-OmpF porin